MLSFFNGIALLKNLSSGVLSLPVLRLKMMIKIHPARSGAIALRLRKQMHLCGDAGQSA